MPVSATFEQIQAYAFFERFYLFWQLWILLKMWTFLTYFNFFDNFVVVDHLELFWKCEFFWPFWILLTYFNVFDIFELFWQIWTFLTIVWRKYDIPSWHIAHITTPAVSDLQLKEILYPYHCSLSIWELQSVTFIPRKYYIPIITHCPYDT